MKEHFINYTQALALNELGFDEPCMFVHDTWGNIINWTEDGEGEHKNSHVNASIYYSAPLKSQVFKWFRDEHKLSYSLDLVDNSKEYYYDFTILDSKNRDYDDENCFDSCRRTLDKRKFGTYEEAESACIDKLISILKEKKS